MRGSNQGDCRLFGYQARALFVSGLGYLALFPQVTVDGEKHSGSRCASLS